MVMTQKMVRLTKSQLSKSELLQLGLPQHSKYGNKWTEYGGRMYQSKKEANRAYELDMLKKAGEITDYKPQVKIPLKIGIHHICYYIADFLVQHKDGHIEYEDVKGYKKGSAYQMFKLKKKLVFAIHGITIKEI